jgi:hypothetical protein
MRRRSGRTRLHPAIVALASVPTVLVRDKGNRDETRHYLMSNPGEYEIEES